MSFMQKYYLLVFISLSYWFTSAKSSSNHSDLYLMLNQENSKVYSFYPKYELCYLTFSSPLLNDLNKRKKKEESLLSFMNYKYAGLEANIRISSGVLYEKDKLDNTNFFGWNDDLTIFGNFLNYFWDYLLE